MEHKFVPLLFAGDINVYSMARAFHEQYGIKSHVYGKYMTMPCANSKIINYNANPRADVQEVFLQLVLDFARKYENKQVLLIGCGDSYVQLISENLGKYPDNVIAPYIPAQLMNDLIHKEKFYAMCEEVGVDYPDTFVHKKEMGSAFELPFQGPYIIKPANGIAYWQNPFDTQKKVYKVATLDAVNSVLSDIYASGYNDSVIIQNFIPGDDTHMAVLTNYSDKHGKVKMMCFGHVLLEEHTPHGIGNHAVIITEANETVEEQFGKLLEEMNYIGFSNFDLKYDERDGKYKVFEINTRQGRSNYYVTHAGANTAKLLVDEYVEGKDTEPIIVRKESLWMVVPKSVAFRYIHPQKYKDRMRKLISEGKAANPLLYNADKAPGRRVRLFKSLMAHHLKFKKYAGK